MNIAVAGGSGFLGSHLCEYLLKNGNKVLCIDNLYTGSKDNLKTIANHKNFRFLNKDIRYLDFKDLKGISQIYNLACPASPKQYKKDPIYTMDVCYIGTQKLLEIAKYINAIFLHTSTSEIYGDPKVHPQPEIYFGNVNTVGPRSCYDEGKRISETLCYEYWMKYKMNIRIVRVFNTYGPRMHPDDGRVISNFCVQSLKDLPHTIYGDGNQTRSLCYFSDMINGFVEIMNLKDEYVFPVNLGSNFEYSINTISNLISNLVGVKNKVNYVDLPQDDPLLRKPDLTRAKNLISWNPSVSVEEGITNIISYYREKMANDLNIATS